MEIRLTNTMSRRKRDLQALKIGEVGNIYVWTDGI